MLDGRAFDSTENSLGRTIGLNIDLCIDGVQIPWHAIKELTIKIVHDETTVTTNEIPNNH